VAACDCAAAGPVASIAIANVPDAASPASETVKFRNMIDSSSLLSLGTHAGVTVDME